MMHEKRNVNWSISMTSVARALRPVKMGILQTILIVRR